MTIALIRFFIISIVLLSWKLSLVFVSAGRQCGTHITAQQIQVAEAHFKSNHIIPPAFFPGRPTIIDVHFHVIQKDETRDGGNISYAQIVKQVALLNKVFKPAGLYFLLTNVTRTLDPQWFADAGPGTGTQATMKEALHVGSVKTLNVYTVGFEERQWQASGIMGYTTFPWLYSEATAMDDGVVIKHSTLPGSTEKPYNLGASFVHEVGHWVGLYHPFEGGCDTQQPDDGVMDTPRQEGPILGCPAYSHSCNGTRPDAIHNYMGYADDSCMTGLTPGQIRRLRSQIATYRGIRF